MADMQNLTQKNPFWGPTVGIFSMHWGVFEYIFKGTHLPEFRTTPDINNNKKKKYISSKSKWYKNGKPQNISNEDCKDLAVSRNQELK